MEQKTHKSNPFSLLDGGSATKQSIFNGKVIPINIFPSKGKNISETIFNALESILDDNDAENWENNSWRMDYFSWLKETINKSN